MTHFTVLLEYDPDGPGYVVTVPSLPGCFTQGAMVEEALARAREAVAGHVAALVATGRPVPAELASPLMAVVDIDEPTAVPA